MQLRDRHHYLISLLKKQWPRLLLTVICMLLMSAAKAATAWLIKPAVDDIFFDKNTTMLNLIPLMVVGLYLVQGFATYWQQVLMSHVGFYIVRDLRNRLYDRIMDLPISFFHREKTGVLMSRVTSDVNIIRNMVSSAVTSSLKDVFTLCGLSAVILYQDWKLAILALVILPLAFFPVVSLGRRVRRVTIGAQQAMGALSVTLHETFAGNKIVKAFGQESFEKKRFHEKTMQLFKLEMKAVRYKGLSSPVMEFLGGVAVALVIWYGGHRVIAGASTPGTFFSFLGAVLMLYEPAKNLSKLNNRIQEGLAGADRVFDIIEATSEIVEASHTVALTQQAHSVTFQDVDFKYEADLVLKGIQLKVDPGEVVALVGTSGGGKTSLVNLIPRFYDVTRGAVLIDEVDVRCASLKSLRDQIAIVTQEPILFNDTVYNNILYGNRDATLAQVEAAARAAYAYDFIQSFPKGFETGIGELGSRLSGGEKQRLCIARALLKDAPILILDEATSALDAESETLVQKALENLMRGRTTFLIAHRFSTVSYARRIVVIKDGQIVEQGAQESLLALKGEYCKLYQMQFRDGNGRIGASLAEKIT